ncbi:hypothetical protein [Xenorhabdus bharatensis]|uniref:hypothetical protein n=1 Tax=Xenorhabdus bharatensis TaxID=3136256 RepID=UPI0030F3AB50
MFRTKSLNINRPVEFDSLARSKSFSDMRSLPTALNNIRYSIITKEVEPQEVVRATNIIKKNMGIDWVNFHSYRQLDEEQERWYQRHEKATNIFSSMLYEVKNHLKNMEKNKKEEMTFFVSYFRNIPIGALTLSLEYNEIPEVSFIATHCGIRDCGVLLIEEAVNKSQQLGMGGRLKLYSLQGAESAYINMGFFEEYGEMYLEPSKQNNKWQWNEKEKRYKLFC